MNKHNNYSIVSNSSKSNTRLLYAASSDTIKASVTMADAIRFYLPNIVVRRDRIPCPFHNGTDYNLSFSDNAFYCFVCHEGGSVIDFVMKLFHLPFRLAVERIGADFGLRLPVMRGVTMRERVAAQKAVARKWEEQERAEQRRRIVNDKYQMLCDLKLQLEDTIRGSDPSSTVFATTVHMLQNVEYSIDALIKSEGW